MARKRHGSSASAAEAIPATRHADTSARANQDKEAGGCDDHTSSRSTTHHLGFTLSKRWLDADTVEYEVRRSRCDALTSSAGLPLLWAFASVALIAAAVAKAAAPADGGAGDLLGEGEHGTYGNNGDNDPTLDPEP
jgi:hypothetical protein